jgi:hypothetical protein
VLTSIFRSAPDQLESHTEKYSTAAIKNIGAMVLPITKSGEEE